MATYERQFSAEVRKDLEDFYGEDIHVNLIPDMMRTGKKPYDFYFVYQSHFVAVECKLCEGETFNTKTEIKPHQPDSIKQVRKCGGHGIFLLCFNKHKTSFIFNGNQLDIMLNEFGTSLKYDDFEEHLLIKNLLQMKRGKFGDITRWEVEKLTEAAQLCF